MATKKRAIAIVILSSVVIVSGFIVGSILLQNASSEAVITTGQSTQALPTGTEKITAPVLSTTHQSTMNDSVTKEPSPTIFEMNQQDIVNYLANEGIDGTNKDNFAFYEINNNKYFVYVKDDLKNSNDYPLALIKVMDLRLNNITDQITTEIFESGAARVENTNDPGYGQCILFIHEYTYETYKIFYKIDSKGKLVEIGTDYLYEGE